LDLRELGLRIKSRREKLRLRQADVANALQISSQAVSKWERGENAPDIAILSDLTRLLGVSIDWLLGSHLPQDNTFPATVFCTSINGFAEKSAAMSPADVAVWANNIYYGVTESLLKFDGIAIKYIGDGFLGFFAGTNQQQRALQAALYAKRLLNTPELVVTLHHGDIFLGPIGHPDYARSDILGATVNTTFLIMPWIAQNCDSGIGITQTVVENLREQANFSPCGEVDVKGVDSPIAIYQTQ